MRYRHSRYDLELLFYIERAAHVAVDKPLKKLKKIKPATAPPCSSVYLVLLELLTRESVYKHAAKTRIAGLERVTECH